MKMIPFFRAPLFTRYMLYSINRILNEKFKTRAIESCKSEVLTLYPSGDTRWRKGVIKPQVGLRVSYIDLHLISMITEKLLRL